MSPKIPIVGSRITELVIISLVFIGLIILRHAIGAFGFSLGYLYVGVISLSGFWFRIKGGIIAATAASGIFLIELFAFPGLVARDVAINGIVLRLFVYYVAGVGLGYLARIEQMRMSKIEQLNEQKNMFVGIAAHDLRNPLSSIALSSHALLHDIEAKPPTEKKIRVTLQAIHGASERMLSLVDDLLNITTIEAGKLDLKLNKCNYIELAKRNVEFNRIIAERNGVDIELDIGSAIPDLAIDAIKIDEVLNNLLGNAIKYAPSGSKIHVSISSAEDEIKTCVTDRGPGIEEENISKIFNAFYRSKHPPKKTVEQKSTGLGLAIAKRIIELMVAGSVSKAYQMKERYSALPFPLKHLHRDMIM